MTDETDISDEAVRDATGRDWAEWFAVLDDMGAREMDHRAIARALQDDGLVDSGWWAQSITVAYEKQTGQRVTGETADAGFQLGAQKTIAVPAERAWELLTSPTGVEAWLGGPAPGLAFEPGETVETENGYRLEVRTVDPGSRVRMRWTPPDRDDPTTLQIYVQDNGDRSAIRFHHEQLADADERDRMKTRWKGVLADLERLATPAEDR